MEKEALRQTLEQHRFHVTTVREWNSYAREKGLPSATTLIRTFGSWMEVKRNLQLDDGQASYTREELLAIATAHMDHFATIEQWDEYADQKRLPTASRYIAKFGSWSTVKKALALNPHPRQKKYTTEEIKELVLTHKEHFASKSAWEEYAKEHKLPNYLTVVNYISWKEIKKIADQPIRYNYTEQELIDLAREHHAHFTTKRHWDEFAEEQRLPLSSTYARRFGSWQKAKYRCRV